MGSFSPFMILSPKTCRCVVAITATIACYWLQACGILLRLLDAYNNE